MSFFSISTLDEIRIDPSSIVDVYGAAQSQFIADLGMTGLSDAAYKAAFCTVMAYELAAYGEEPSSYDLSVLLASPTLACDRYVTLAWELLDLLGVSGDDGTAVGWDGGAVGNHAQLLFDDGLSQLLLDPTIGLVVNGVTLDGLIGGVQYTEMTSFFSRDDITAFNAQVIAAVQQGSYKVWDATYFVPGLSEWVNNYAGHLGLTIDLGNDVQTIVGFINADNIDAGPGDDVVYGGQGDDVIHGGPGNDYLDGGAGVDHAVFGGSRADYTISFDDTGGATVTGPDGADVLRNFESLQFDDQIVPVPVGQVVETDALDQFNWSSISTQVDWRGDAVRIDYHYDDGSSQIYEYDVLSQFAWDRIQTITDQQDQVTKQIYDENDGSHVSYMYNVSGAGDWTVITSYLTSDWKASIEQVYDEKDGSHVIYLYDVNNAGAWSSITSYVSSDWTVKEHVYNEDDGSHVIYQYDVNNDGTWSSITSYLTSDWTTTTLVYNQDDGSHVVYQYDTSQSYAWISLETQCNADWSRSKEVLNNDDGTHTVLQYNDGNQLIAQALYTADWHLIA